VKFALVLLVASAAALVPATAAYAQSACPVCDESLKLSDALRKIEIGNEAQRAQGEALGREALALVTAFQGNPPPPKQGRRAFEALVALGVYAAPFSPPGAYEKALAAIVLNDAEYRKRYQARMRKGMRARDRRESCQVRLLQTNVSVAECMLEQRSRGETEEIARKRCDASYNLAQCLAKRK
jgi:hypothetical protein